MTRSRTFEQLAERLEELLGHRVAGAIATVMLAAAAVTGCGGGSEPVTYSAQLAPVGGSGVDGEARLELAGDHLELDIRATGLVPNRVHEQRLQADGGGDRCGGDALLALAPYPTVGDDGRLDYDNTLELDRDELDLSNATVVLFGSSGGGRYRPEAPVACGRLER